MRILEYYANRKKLNTKKFCIIILLKVYKNCIATIKIPLSIPSGYKHTPHDHQTTGPPNIDPYLDMQSWRYQVITTELQLSLQCT